MKKYICSILCFSSALVGFASFKPNPESQKCYDMQLYDYILSDGLVQRVNEDFAVAESEGIDLFGIANRNGDWPYKYFVEKVRSDYVLIKAVNKAGKRTYLYDTKWNVVCYGFSSEEEKLKIGKRILRWMVENDLSEEEEKALLESLEWRGLFLPNAHEEYAKYDVLGCVGQFLIYDELREKLWKIVSDGKVYMGDRGREICLRSILSNFDSYPESLKKEVMDKLDSYIRRVYREEEFRTEDLKGFLQENFNQYGDTSTF